MKNDNPDNVNFIGELDIPASECVQLKETEDGLFLPIPQKFLDHLEWLNGNEIEIEIIEFGDSDPENPQFGLVLGKV